MCSSKSHVEEGRGKVRGIEKREGQTKDKGGRRREIEVGCGTISKGASVMKRRYLPYTIPYTTPHTLQMKPCRHSARNENDFLSGNI